MRQWHLASLIALLAAGHFVAPARRHFLRPSIPEVVGSDSQSSSSSPVTAPTAGPRSSQQVPHHVGFERLSRIGKDEDVVERGSPAFSGRLAGRRIATSSTRDQTVRVRPPNPTAVNTAMIWTGPG
jgi:hypothetical protein